MYFENDFKLVVEIGMYFLKSTSKCTFRALSLLCDNVDLMDDGINTISETEEEKSFLLGMIDCFLLFRKVLLHLGV